MDGHFAMWHYFVVFAKLENALPAHLVLDHVEQTKVAVGRGWRARATGEGEREREREKERKKGEIRARTMVPQSPPPGTTTARGVENGRPFEHTYPRSPSRWRTRPRPRSPCPRRMPANRNSSTASGSPPRASLASRVPPANCANPDRRRGRPRRRRDRSSRPPGMARPQRRRGRLLFSQQGWMDGWMDGWIYGQTSEYDIRSSGGVAPDDERTRAT